MPLIVWVKRIGMKIIRALRGGHAANVYIPDTCFCCYLLNDCIELYGLACDAASVIAPLQNPTKGS